MRRTVLSDGAAGRRRVKVVPCPSRERDEDLAVLRLGEVLHDREAEAGAAEVARARLVDAVEALEDRAPGRASGMPMPVSLTSMRTQSGREPDTATSMRPPGSLYLMALSSRLSSTCSSARRSASAAGAGLGAHLGLQTAGLELRLQVLEHGPASAATSTGSSARLRVPPSIRESSSRSSIKRRQPLGVAQDHVEVLPALLGRDLAAAQRLREAADRGERRAQLVRDVGHEVAAHALEPADLGHVVEHGDDAEQRALAREAHRVHLELAAAAGRRAGSRAPRARRCARPRASAASTSTRRITSSAGGPRPRPTNPNSSRSRGFARITRCSRRATSTPSTMPGEHGVEPRLLVVRLREPPAQLLGHVVDRARDRAELVARAPRQALREVARRDGRRRRCSSRTRRVSSVAKSRPRAGPPATSPAARRREQALARAR